MKSLKTQVRSHDVRGQIRDKILWACASQSVFGHASYHIEFKLLDTIETRITPLIRRALREQR